VDFQGDLFSVLADDFDFQEGNEFALEVILEEFLNRVFIRRSGDLVQAALQEPGYGNPCDFLGGFVDEEKVALRSTEKTISGALSRKDR